jgi:anti-sigma28 factor (negative regulator of flagellin synthesis)
MRITPINLSEIDTSQIREKPGTEATARPSHPVASGDDEAVVSSATLDSGVVESATRELDASISARLDQVKEQLQSGNYAVDYDRLARRLADEGFGS